MTKCAMDDSSFNQLLHRINQVRIIDKTTGFHGKQLVSRFIKGEMIETFNF